MAAETNALLVAANGAILNDDIEAAITAITAIAQHVFTIAPFVPDPLPDNWGDVLRCWLLGRPLAEVSAGNEAEVLQFVEGGLVYRLPWAMEAIRVRALANGDIVGNPGLTLEEYELGVAVSAVETGTLNMPAAILIQAGFTSRLGAIKAVNDTGATFSNAFELNAWLASAEVANLSDDADWPTPETKGLWDAFRQSFAPAASRTWSVQEASVAVTWSADAHIGPGDPLRCVDVHGVPTVFSADGTPLGHLDGAVNAAGDGLLQATVSAAQGEVSLRYIGPDDLWL
jgi:hypothetical protein